MNAQINLLANVAATGAATPVTFGGRYLALVSGTFDSATVTIQILGPDGTTYITVPDFSKTAAGSGIVYLPANCTVKGVVTGGSSPTGLYLSLYRMEG